MSEEEVISPIHEVVTLPSENLEEEGEGEGEEDWLFDEAEEDFYIEEEQEEEEEEEVYYDTNEYISKPYLSEKCTLPRNIVEFDYSYGYDCLRWFNLCVVDQVILIFASGNIIHFLDASTGKKWYRRSASGCGIGHITTNPKQPHIAVGEKGVNPLIIIYEWPSFQIVTILKGGTTAAYSFLNYSPDGELLCSQGDRPDYMLTVWEWRKHKILLRSKAYGQSVFNSRFSLYVPGHLTTSGVSHIKFWKINKTFTGLKLQGELGRFGKSEICNIIGFLALPDEKVVSGCEWGNILVWDGGLIRVEVFRRGRHFCHEAPITQFIYNNGDLTTVAMDGTIKVWYYETIELADPPEEDRIIEVEPIYEFEIGDYYHKAKLLVIVKASPKDPDNLLWYGQDANGGIWKLDLCMSYTAEPPTMIFQCHAGAVAAIQCSPFSYHLASLGVDGKMFIYDYRAKTMILKKEFLTGGCSLLWLPLAVESSGCVLIGGFADGIIRVICVSLHEYIEKTRPPNDEYINLIQLSKPHTKPVTVVTINPKNNIIVTGSEDATIFVYQISQEEQFPKLIPIGYVPVSGEVTHCTWKPRLESTILVSCKNGTFMEIKLPTEPRIEEPSSYLLPNISAVKNTFVSIKSELRRSQRLKEIMKEREEIFETRKKELQEKAEVSGVPLDNSLIEVLQDEINAEEPDLPELYIPPVPNPILFANYTPPGKTIWLSMGGYDAGFLYQYNFQTEGPVKYTMITDADDIEIQCYHYYHNNRYLILGLNNGSIRVVRINHQDFTDLSDYWSFSMHDNENGTIRNICFNYNYSYMFTCGNDGNVFAYIFTPENKELKFVNIFEVTSKGFPEQIATDIDDINTLSLEQVKNKVENEEKMKEANTYKIELMETLKSLEKKFEVLIRRNSKLPKSQQLTPDTLVLDERIVEDLRSQLQEEMDLVKTKIAWQSEKARIQFDKVNNYFIKPVEAHSFKVYGVNNKEIFAETFRIRKLGPEFKQLEKVVMARLEDQEAKGRAHARLFSEEVIVETITRRPNPVEGLLKQIMGLCGDYRKNIKLRRLLRKYRERKDRLESRRIEWYDMMKKKPNPEKPDPDDVASIELAKDTIGNYQLKTASNYKVPKNAKVTTVRVFDFLLKTRQEIYNVKKNYNEQVLQLRKRKLDMIERHKFLRDILLEIAKEIPKDKIRYPPNLPTFDEDLEFPENKFNPSFEGIFEELPKRFKTMYKEENTKKKEIKPLDREHEMLILEKRGQKLGKVHSRLSLMKYSGITGARNIQELEDAGKDDQVPTPWEKECRKLRIIKRLYEQDGIIDEMDTSIREFDEEIIRLNELKYKTEVDLKFLDLYLLTLNQEVLILKKFEAAEEQKENRLFEKMRDKHELQKKLNEINSKVESRNREIRRCEEEIKNLITLFHATTAENKFYDFLKRIFKKKYRPPKKVSEDSDSDSESESSSSSEEEDAKSLDSKDIGVMRLEENVCPQGCDQELYEWTFTQRSARHALELSIMEEKRHIEVHKKEYDTLVKKIKSVETQYLACKEDLEEYMREKQGNLNEVETVVVLRLSQIQNFKSESEIEKISDSILFSSVGISNLYKRVGELKKETDMEKQKHEKNRKHLTRMKIDVDHMKNMIVKLNKDIDEAMIRKFGMKVDIDDVEETLLKRLVAEMHNIVLEMEKGFERKLQKLRNTLERKQSEHARKIQDNTERYNLLTVLQEEKVKIQETVRRQDKRLCMQNVREDEDQDKDIENLRKVVKMQEEKISDLRKEITMLKLKVKPKPRYVSSEFPDVIQKILITGCDGEVEEIDECTKEELRDMYEEGKEIAQDAREGSLSKDDIKRMKVLTEEMIDKLPEKCRRGVIMRLSKNLKKKEPLSDLCPEEIFQDIIKTLKTESFLEAIEIVKEMLDSLVPQFGAADPKP